MNTYPFLLVLHLCAAFVFVGTVTFEVLFLEPVQKRLPADVRRALGGQLGPRVRAVVPLAVAVGLVIAEAEAAIHALAFKTLG